MNKKTIFNTAVVIAILVLAYFQFIKTDKVVYIETNILMSKYKGMQDASATFEKKATKWQANTDSLISNWEGDLKDYEKGRKQMTVKERKLTEELLRNRQQQITQYRKAMEMKAREEEQKMTQTVLAEVNEFLVEYGKKHGFKYILGANGTGNIIYAKDAFNITDDVLEILNNKYTDDLKK